MRHSTFRRAAAGLAVVLILILALGRYPRISNAVEVPQPGPLQIQTSGPNTPLNVGDWYSNVTGDSTYHLLIIPVPDTYPATQDITIQLFDPECYNAAGQIYDEVRDDTNNDTTDMAYADTTRFLLLAPDGVTVVQDITYPSAAATDQQWVIFATFNTATYGAGEYELRITTADNDDNTWRIDITPDDPDGIPNGNEIGTPFMRITYQFDPPLSPPDIPEFISYDHTFWFYVPITWTQPTLTLHNFDFDYPGLMAADASLTYVSPSGTTYSGTLSGNQGWNDPALGNGGTSPVRAGDSVPTEFGWWQIQLHDCYNNNQILVEAEGLPMYTDRPDYLAADVGLTKVRTTPSPVPVGGTVSFDVTMTNNGLTAITTLPLEDTYDPTYLDFQSALPAPDFVDEATGTLRWDNLAPPSGLVPGQSVTVTLNFTALASTAGLPGGVTVNTATVSGAVDDNDHQLPDQTASDNVAIYEEATPTSTPTSAPTSTPISTSTPTSTPTASPTPTVTPTWAPIDPRITKSGDPSQAHIGDQVTFTLTAHNYGNTPATGVRVTDQIESYLDITRVTASKGTVSWDNVSRLVTVDIGTLAPNEEVTITIETVVNETATPAPLLIENQAHLTFNEGEQRDSEIVTVEIIEESPAETATPSPEPSGAPPEIPEPLTLLLLGSGLASLAGYAALRRRT
ncbi:MAG: hypothetical protein DRI80_14045 [Chloroflexota bacterium]|nr:MAG: hypothetical protein DRI80_14045 [Chloroflexota bacterium]